MSLRVIKAMSRYCFAKPTHFVGIGFTLEARSHSLHHGVVDEPGGGVAVPSSAYHGTWSLKSTLKKHRRWARTPHRLAHIPVYLLSSGMIDI